MAKQGTPSLKLTFPNTTRVMLGTSLWEVLNVLIQHFGMLFMLQYVFHCSLYGSVAEVHCSQEDVTQKRVLDKKYSYTKSSFTMETNRN